jgi:hypothetical protein
MILRSFIKVMPSDESSNQKWHLKR